jgi:ring-1,2-phenylacetyl-CoA epoxidase subunit PaaD
MQQAVDNLWRFTGELFLADDAGACLVEQGIAVDPRELQAEWQSTVHTALLDAGCRSRKKRRSAAAANRGCTVNISGRCWRRCSICSALIPASSGNRRWLCNVCRYRARRGPRYLGLLSAIPDPEVPVLTITDLGMVRSVARTARLGDWLYADLFGLPGDGASAGGDPRGDGEHGYTPVHIVLQLDPPWTTDWMSQDARERLRQYGISPPQGHACHAGMPGGGCPRCGSTHTSLISEFGSTACKALYRCDSCREPFDYFKCI